VIIGNTMTCVLGSAQQSLATRAICTKKVPIYFLNFLAKPQPEADSYGDAAGAYVNCWIGATKQSEAEALAKQYIREYGWSVESKEDAFKVSREDYVEDKKRLRYFEQAVSDGSCLVYHSWGVNAPDE